MATTDEIEGVRPEIDGDTDSCSRQATRTYAAALGIVQPGVCVKGRASHHLRTFLSKHRDGKCKASRDHRRGRRHASAPPAFVLANVRRYRPVAEDASSEALSRHEVVNGGRTVLRKDFDVSKTPICYPLEIARWPCDLSHVTVKLLNLLRPAGESTAWQTLTSQKSIHGRGNQALQRLSVAEARACDPLAPRLIGQSVSFLCQNDLFSSAPLCTRCPSCWRCMELG